jgi:hypothetical protein
MIREEAPTHHKTKTAAPATAEKKMAARAPTLPIFKAGPAALVVEAAGDETVLVPVLAPVLVPVPDVVGRVAVPVATDVEVIEMGTDVLVDVAPVAVEVDAVAVAALEVVEVDTPVEAGLAATENWPVVEKTLLMFPTSTACKV